MRLLFLKALFLFSLPALRLFPLESLLFLSLAALRLFPLPPLGLFFHAPRGLFLLQPFRFFPLPALTLFARTLLRHYAFGGGSLRFRPGTSKLFLSRRFGSGRLGRQPLPLIEGSELGFQFNKRVRGRTRGRG